MSKKLYFTRLVVACAIFTATTSNVLALHTKSNNVSHNSQTITAQAPLFKEGVDYTVLTQPIASKANNSHKVNVKEFYFFGCIHCKDLEPLLEQSLAKNKKVSLQKVHVYFQGAGAQMTALAKIAATIDILKWSQLYVPVFDANFANENLADSHVLETLLKRNHLSTSSQAQFMQTYNSFAVNAMLGTYSDLTSQYNITATPTIIVNDKYELAPMLPPRIVAVTNYLVDMTLKTKQHTPTS